MINLQATYNSCPEKNTAEIRNSFSKSYFIQQPDVKPITSPFDRTFEGGKPLTQNKVVTDDALHNALTLFKSHGLHDLDAAKLMDRVDSKFLLPISLLPDLLYRLQQHYSVLEINNKRISSYHNQYLDTPEMAFYHDHHNGKLNRYKVRRRRYVDTDTEFLEVKLKNNKSRTIKNRMRLPNESGEIDLSAQFIDEQMHTNTTKLNPAKFSSSERKRNKEKVNSLGITQQSGYHRIALANEAKAERLTLDYNLWYKSKTGNTQVQLPGFFIAELKQHKKSKRSPFYQMMSANNIFPMAFSKYCIGCALLYKSSIKSNRFKAILSHIEKLNRHEKTSFLKSN